MRGIVRYLGRKSSRHPYLFLGGVLLLTIGAGYLAWTRLRIKMDVADLLPSDSELARATRIADLDFGGGDFVLAVAEIRKEAPQSVHDDPTAFFDTIKDEFSYAFEDVRFFREGVKRLRPRDVMGFHGNDASLVTLMNDQDFDQIEAQIFPAGMSGAISGIAAPVQLLQSIASRPEAMFTISALQADPFGVERVLASHSVILTGPLKSQYRDGFYYSKDNQVMVHMMWPSTPSTNILRARDLVRFLDETREGLYLRNPTWRDAIDIQFIGPHIENAASVEGIRSNLLTTSIVSIVAILLLFVIAFRQPEGLLFIAIPLAVGLTWTFGLTSLFVPEITQVTLIFAAVIIALGIDFSIHIYNRYQEDMRTGKSVEKALRNAFSFTAPSILAGATSTGLAFLGMLLTRFQGFQQLGLFGGIGIVFCLIAVVLTLPPLMILFAKTTSRAKGGALATFGLKKVSFTVQAYPRMTVAACLSIIVFLGMHAQNVAFNDDFQTLRQPPDQYVKSISRVREHFSLPSNQVLVITEARELDKALENNDQIYRNLASMQDLYKFSAIDSLRDIFPSPKTQRENLTRVADWKLDRMIAELRSNQGESQLLPPRFFEPAIERLTTLQEECRHALSNPKWQISREAGADQTFTDILRGYLTNDEPFSNYRVLTRVYPSPDNAWEQRIPPAFLERLRTNIHGPEPLVLGNVRLSSEVQSVVLVDLSRVVLLVFLAVGLFLFIHFRSYKRAALAMIPVLCGLICMLGVMAMLGLKLSYLNLIAIPMIIGFAVDSGIHLLERFYEDEKKNLQLAVERTGRAVIIASLTTIFGFGSLSVAGFQGIREIGILSIIGVTGGLFSAMVFLPALLRMIDSRYRYAGGPGDDIG
ncbi:MMPL family transporter [Candidatus Sumerlaeota bacterium]|nr:MMPL family transporter [Candidatus Sumerlaeota bacterium]